MATEATSTLTFENLLARRGGMQVRCVKQIHGVKQGSDKEFQAEPQEDGDRREDVRQATN
jgi:hypothetical protein